MTCERVDVDGGVMIVCRAGPRRRRCSDCREWADYLCDARGCDVPLCGHCRIHVPPNRDYCRRHRAAAMDEARALRLPFLEGPP